MRFAVVYTGRARNHLHSIYDYIAEKAGPVIARNYTRQIEDACQRLENFPLRGTARDDVRPGLRIIGFRRRVTIAFSVEASDVVIHGIFYGGRDFERDLLADAREAGDD